jgi:hypothetical protein
MTNVAICWKAEHMWASPPWSHIWQHCILPQASNAVAVALAQLNTGS